jgi:hypothetical protein
MSTENLVLNGDFNDNLNHWAANATGGGYVALKSDASHGNFAALQTGDMASLSQTIVSESGEYTFSFDSRNIESNCSVRVWGVYEHGGREIIIAPQVKINYSISWHGNTHKFSMPECYSKLEIEFYAQYHTILEVDSIVLTKD